MASVPHPQIPSTFYKMIVVSTCASLPLKSAYLRVDLGLSKKQVNKKKKKKEMGTSMLMG